MNSATTIQVTLKGAVATVALNRPDVHNAFNSLMIGELINAFDELGQSSEVRVIVLTGRGRSFCAGADLTTMRAAGEFDIEQNVANGKAIYDLMLAVDSCPKPVVGKINGTAIGGGVGLVAACDIVVAVDRARFGFSEARIGLVPAVISPFVLAKIGVSFGRELFLTGERFNAQEAHKLGLVHHVVPEEDLEAAVTKRVEELLLAAPEAQEAIKTLIRTVAYQPKEAVRENMAQLIAARRASEEGREGMSAFLEKRKPKWQQS